MKLLKLCTVVLVMMLVYNCSQEELINETISQQNNKSSATMVADANEDNSLIIQYGQFTNEAQKAMLRSIHNVKSFKTCNCSDTRIELWIFETDDDDAFIEEKKLGIDGEEEDDIEGTHFNSDMKVEQSLNWPLNNQDVNDFISKLVPENKNVTIAVLDTGVNPNYSGFTTPFLYRNKTENNCTESEVIDYGGWDFVNNDNYPFDDNSHGTIVTHLINDKLISRDVPHQILPVKVFDANGKGNLFNILCGFKYALSKPEVSIINLSFGSYKYRELFDLFIQESQNDALVVASAGNDENNNDSDPHYPSSYNASNILAIAGLEDQQSGQNSLAWFSNYGVHSVDLAAQSYISVFNANNQNADLFGTSYSCAFASAKSATLYFDGVTPTALKQMVVEESIYAPQLDNIKYSAYID